MYGSVDAALGVVGPGGLPWGGSPSRTLGALNNRTESKMRRCGKRLQEMLIMRDTVAEHRQMHSSSKSALKLSVGLWRVAFRCRAGIGTLNRRLVLDWRKDRRRFHLSP